MLYCCLSIDRRWECFCNQVGVILTCALMGDFVKEKHLGVRISTSTLDGLISCLIDDAVQFSFEVFCVIEHLCFVGLIVGVVKGNQPVGIDAGCEVLMNE